MRPFGFLALIAALALVGAACDTDTGDTDGGNGGPTTSEPAAATTTTAANAPTTTDAVALSEECATSSFLVRYPQGWFTNDSGEPCRWFHPEPFELPDRTEATGIAVHLDIEPVAFERIAEDARTGPHVERVIQDEQLEIDGRAAFRLEIVSSGEALTPEGTRVYQYFADVGEGETLVTTTDSAAVADYEAVKATLDAMMDSLQLRD